MIHNNIENDSKLFYMNFYDSFGIFQFISIDPGFFFILVHPCTITHELRDNHEVWKILRNTSISMNLT